MYRYFFRFVVMTLTILTANLITNAISNYMVSYKNCYKPLVFTFIGMLIIVVIFYPLFIKLEIWVKDISVRVIKSGKSLAGKYLGLLFTFLTGLLVLSYFYAKMWYHIDFLQVLLHGNISGYL
jgi:dolichol kinase